MKMNKEIVIVRLSDIIPNRFQPRLAFDEEALNELADSIREHGIIQPLILRDLGNKYEIIAGERRYKAAQLAGATEVPAIIGIMDDQTSAELALIENIQRKDLSAIEEAKSYKKILDMGDFTQEELAKRMGKSQSTIANKMRLLTLTNEVQVALMNNLISERHARCLLQLKDENAQKDVLNKIISQRMTVRDTDNYIKEILGISKEKNKEAEIQQEIPEASIEENSGEITTQENMNEEAIENENPNVYAHSKNTDFVDIKSLTQNNLSELATDTLNENTEYSNQDSNFTEEESNSNQSEERDIMFDLPTMPEMPGINNEEYSEEQNSEYYDNQNNESVSETNLSNEENISYELPTMPEVEQQVNEESPSEQDIQYEKPYTDEQYQQEYDYNQENQVYEEQENIPQENENYSKPDNISRLKMATAIRLAKDALNDIQSAGYQADIEERESGNNYQIIINVQK